MPSTEHDERSLSRDRREKAMPPGLTVAEVFRAAGLDPTGPVQWSTPITETRPGVYVLSLVSDPYTVCGANDVGYLPDHLFQKWLNDNPVIYIGKTRRPLRKRINEFYRHIYGNKSPHRGGQAALLLKPTLWIFWAATDQPTWAERAMIEMFRDTANALPFANRCRGTATEAPKPLIPDELKPPSGDARTDTLRKRRAAG
jgi:hypothetical protein